jgi:hypothetical protein
MPTTISTCDSASRACKNSGLACGKLARLKWRLNVVEVIEVLRWSPRRTPAGQYRRLVWDTPFSRNSQDQMTMCQKRVLSDRRLPEVGVVQRGQRMLDWVQLVTFERAPSLVSEHGAIWGKLSSKVRGMSAPAMRLYGGIPSEARLVMNPKEGIAENRPSCLH